MDRNLKRTEPDIVKQQFVLKSSKRAVAKLVRYFFYGAMHCCISVFTKAFTLQARCFGSIAVKLCGDMTNRLVVVLGCTGTGKSDLAVSIAENFNGEVINADSMQLYNGEWYLESFIFSR